MKAVFPFTIFQLHSALFPQQHLPLSISSPLTSHSLNHISIPLYHHLYLLHGQVVILQQPLYLHLLYLHLTQFLLILTLCKPGLNQVFTNQKPFLQPNILSLLIFPMNLFPLHISKLPNIHIGLRQCMRSFLPCNKLVLGP